jgi:hypothetical protein
MSKDLVSTFDPETHAIWDAISKGKRWGNAVTEVEERMKELETPSQKRKREAKEAASRKALQNLEEQGRKRNAAKAKEAEEEAKKANVAKKKARHVNKITGELKKIAKMCKWQCQGEQCWAHDQKACPYIHRGEPGWNESMAVKKKKRGGGTCTRRRKQRRTSTRKN